LLTELALAGVLLFLILGSVMVWKRDLSAELMIGLVIAAAVILIAVVIFGTIL
jgi:hypothetical protein